MMKISKLLLLFIILITSISYSVEFTNITKDTILTEFGDYQSNGLCSINDFIDPFTNNSFYWILIQNNGILSSIFNSNTLTQYDKLPLPFGVVINNNMTVAFPKSCANKITHDIINCYVFQNVWTYSYIQCKIFYYQTQQWSNPIDIVTNTSNGEFNSLTENPNLICLNDSYLIVWTYFNGQSQTNKSIKYSTVSVNGTLMLESKIFLNKYNGTNLNVIYSNYNNTFLIEYKQCLQFKCYIIGSLCYFNDKIYTLKDNIQINQNEIENYYKPTTNVSILQRGLDLNFNNKCCYISLYEYGHKTQSGQLKMNIYINFVYYNGTQIFNNDIKVLDESLLNINSRLVELKMLNNNKKNNGSYFMILYNNGNMIFGDVFYLYLNEEYNYKLKKENQIEFIYGKGVNIGNFEAFVSGKNDNLIITWSEYVSPSDTIKAHVWNVKN